LQLAKCVVLTIIATVLICNVVVLAHIGVVLTLIAMTEAEVHAAALADPDAQPLTPERLATMRRVPRVKSLRRALGMTQEEFATRYHIPLGTLRDWEQGRSEPDQPAKAYLKAIAGDPAAVLHALEAGPR
jgi:putative transcriptional regulator